MKVILLLSLFSFSCLLSGQNLIGFKDFEIRRFMKENKGDMNINKVNNYSFNYLKYTDNSDSQTLLFFLTTDSVCRSIRIICDSIVKTEKVKEYNSLYKKKGENIWVDTRNGKDYLIEIRDEQWCSVITIEPFK